MEKGVVQSWGALADSSRAAGGFGPERLPAPPARLLESPEGDFAAQSAWKVRIHSASASTTLVPNSELLPHRLAIMRAGKPCGILCNKMHDVISMHA